jgi:hypothetical protein
MYHQGRTKESSFIRVVTTYGMNNTSSESAQMDSLEGVYQVKESRSLKDVTHHHMGGHYGAFRTHAKIRQSGFFWPTMYEDTKNFIQRCGACQRHRNINSRDAMPLINKL